MARNRLPQGQGYGDMNAPAAGNPYAQQPQAYAPPAANPYAQQQQQYPPQAGYPPRQGGGDFWDQLTSTNQLLDDLKNEIERVRAAHQRLINSTDAKSVAELDEASETARQLREQCKDSVKLLYKTAKGDKKMQPQAQSAKDRFTKLIENHRLLEADYRKKTRERAERQYKIVKPDATQQEINEAIESDNPQVFAQALLNTNVYGAARGAYREVQERHAEIQKIERTMNELAQMFQEMAMLVEQQDEAIQQIEQQTYGVHTDLERGNVELNGAIVKARKARKKKWICFGICVLIIIAIALAVGIGVGVTQASKPK